MAKATKRLQVTRFASYFSIEYDDVCIEAWHMDQGTYNVDAYDLEIGPGKVYTKSHRVTDPSLEVIMASPESRRLDMWWPLQDNYCLLSKTQCEELDDVVEDILAGKYDYKPKPESKQKKEPELFIPTGVHPNQGVLDQESAEFSDMWMKRFRDNK